MRSILILLGCSLIGLVSCSKEKSQSFLERQERQKLADDAAKDFSGLTAQEVMIKKYNALDLNCEFKSIEPKNFKSIQSFSINLLAEDEMSFVVVDNGADINLEISTINGIEILNRQNRYVESGYIFDLTYSPVIKFKTEYEVESEEEDDSRVVKVETYTTVYESQAPTKAFPVQLAPSLLYEKNGFQLECRILSVLKPEYQDHYKIKKLEAK